MSHRSWFAKRSLKRLTANPNSCIISTVRNGSNIFSTHRERNYIMATNKLFTVFGVSKLNGEHKVRFASDLMRTKVLTKHGHEDIRLIEVTTAVSKFEGITQLQTHADFQDAAAQCAISEYLQDNAPKAVKVTSPSAVSKVKTAVKTPQVPAIKGMTPLGLKMEDAPF